MTSTKDIGMDVHTEISNDRTSVLLNCWRSSLSFRDRSLRPVTANVEGEIVLRRWQPAGHLVLIRRCRRDVDVEGTVRPVLQGLVLCA
jgi:hypothetical protein